jgi:hypothetical protein
MATKGLIRVAGFIVLLFTMAGCLEVSTVVSVKPDGTGTVAERLLMSKASFGQMSSLAEGDKKGQQGQIPDKAALEKKSLEMGEGVHFISVRPVATKSHEGYEALYSFRDINLLQVNSSPDSGVSADSASGEQAPKKKKKFVHFLFKQGTPSRLVIVMDQEKEAGPSSTVAAKPQQNPEQLKMATSIMKQFFKGMRVFMAVDINGSILSTNATHRKEKRITLMDVDFDKLLAKPKQFASFAALGSDPSSKEMQKIMKKIPGIKLETQKEVEVSFQ